LGPHRPLIGPGDDVRLTAGAALVEDVGVSPSASILVVDDDRRLAASIRRALAYEGYRVTLAEDGPGALRTARDSAPDLVVLDVMLPGIDGIEVCRRLRAGSESLPILMLTARDSIGDRVTGLDSGADDYLVKPFAYDELVARVRALLRRAAPARGESLAVADLIMDVGAHEAARGSRALELSALEFALLEHFMRHPRLVLSRQALLDAVWATDSETASNVVDVYVGYLRRKMESGGEARLLQTVRGVGYVLREE
jgi:two-component system response regulator MprA